MRNEEMINDKDLQELIKNLEIKDIFSIRADECPIYPYLTENLLDRKRMPVDYVDTFLIFIDEKTHEMTLRLGIKIVTNILAMKEAIRNIRAFMAMDGAVIIKSRSYEGTLPPTELDLLDIVPLQEVNWLVYSENLDLQTAKNLIPLLFRNNILGYFNTPNGLFINKEYTKVHKTLR